VLDAALAVDGDVRRAAADVDEGDAEFLFVGREHGLGRGQLLEDDLVDVETHAVDALDDVLRRGRGPRHDVDLGLEPHPGHPHGVLDPLLLVDDVVLGKDVQDLAVQRDADRAGGVDGAPHVHLLDLAALDGDDAVAVEALDVAAGDPGEHGADLDAGHELGLLDGLLDRLDGAVDVDDDPLAKPLGGGRPQPDDVDAGVGPLGHDGGHFRRPDVETRHDVDLFRHSITPVNADSLRFSSGLGRAVRLLRRCPTLLPSHRLNLFSVKPARPPSP